MPMFCFIAHDTAYYDANILHHDISVGNIMISEGGGGFLINLLLISVFIGNMAIHVGISPLE